jgi:hypothetical protein
MMMRLEKGRLVKKHREVYELTDTGAKAAQDARPAGTHRQTSEERYR